MRLLEAIDLVCRRRGMARSTIDAYKSWVRQYLSFAAQVRGDWVHPVTLGGRDVEAFLNHLVADRDLSASSQNQALNAIVFLYKQVLEIANPHEHLGKFELLRSRRPRRLPTVLSTAEVIRLIAVVPPARNSRLMVELLYGTGMRVSECCTLRVRDLDLGRAQISIRAAKGDKDRIVMLPAALHDRLTRQLDRVRQRWQADAARGGGFAPVPASLDHKRPRAGHEWPFQFVFPSAILRRDGQGRGVCWHVHPSSLDRIVYLAARRAGIGKRVTCHAFRHTPARSGL